MALGLSEGGSSGDRLPVFKFNAVSGDAALQKSVRQTDGTWEKVEQDIAFPQKLIFDFPNIEVGYMVLTKTLVDFKMVKLGTPLPPQPTPEYKQGFRVSLYNKELGLCALSATSGIVKKAMNALHDAYEAGKAANAGKLPVVEFKGTKKVSVETKEGAKNCKSPEWSIVSWIERPEGMKAKEQESASTTTAASILEDDQF